MPLYVLDDTSHTKSPISWHHVRVSKTLRFIGRAQRIEKMIYHNFAKVESSIELPSLRRPVQTSRRGIATFHVIYT
jgi:hypothetical protein